MEPYGINIAASHMGAHYGLFKGVAAPECRAPGRNNLIYWNNLLRKHV